MVNSELAVVPFDDDDMSGVDWYRALLPVVFYIPLAWGGSLAILFLGTLVSAIFEPDRYTPALQLTPQIGILGGAVLSIPKAMFLFYSRCLADTPCPAQLYIPLNSAEGVFVSVVGTVIVGFLHPTNPPFLDWGDTASVGALGGLIAGLGLLVRRSLSESAVCGGVDE